MRFQMDFYWNQLTSGIKTLLKVLWFSLPNFFGQSCSPLFLNELRKEWEWQREMGQYRVALDCIEWDVDSAAISVSSTLWPYVDFRKIRDKWFLHSRFSKDIRRTGNNVWQWFRRLTGLLPEACNGGPWKAEWSLKLVRDHTLLGTHWCNLRVMSSLILRAYLPSPFYLMPSWSDFLTSN